MSLFACCNFMSHDKLYELYKEKYKQDNWLKATTTKYEVGQQLALF